MDSFYIPISSDIVVELCTPVSVIAFVYIQGFSGILYQKSLPVIVDIKVIALWQGQGLVIGNPKVGSGVGQRNISLGFAA